MKKIKFLGALIIMLFISTSVIGQEIPASTFVQDTPETMGSKGCSVTVKWVGSNGIIIQAPVVSTTVGLLGAGIEVVPAETFFMTNGFYPIVETIVEVRYSNEKHAGHYPGLATVLSRTLHPSYWIVYY